ncbi:PREDICTED: heat shock 70 kDa protein 9, mitochondrial-like [Tarenaya hassleriana]|uniref:heat shock 70 kDa protein 9, mitochondrial-like n=1 Tax=Tarenaya hassleriana TaxID=28532 RepID=UPI00053C2966|nr:PREDICTED: heat shock 70 kDa protein 9, mitochondrial-like [Tarenaya hassleriana]
MEERIENAEGIISVVAINDKGELLVGTPAKRFEDSQTQTEMEMAPCKIVKAPNGDAWVEANGQKYSPCQIGAFLLAQIDKTFEAIFRSATVKAPACFRDAQFEVTFYTDLYGDFTVFAIDEATGKDTELDYLIDNGPYFNVYNIEKWLNKYKEKIRTEIAMEIETALSQFKRADRLFCYGAADSLLPGDKALDCESLCKCLGKSKAAREALWNIDQHMSKGSCSGGSDLGVTNSMKEKNENAQRTISAVGINSEGELLVGTSAKRFEGSQTEMGMEMAPCIIVQDANGDIWAKANGQKYFASQIGAFAISKMKEFAEAHLGKTVTEANFRRFGNLVDEPLKVSLSILPDDGVVTLSAEQILSFWKKIKFDVA